MTKWIFVLKLLAQDPETGEQFWDEMVKAPNISFQICIENLVETVNVLRDARIKHEVYCEEQVDEEKEDD